jgi:hypothetical protein
MSEQHLRALKSGRLAKLDVGETIAAVLAGAWRAAPDPIPDDLVRRLPDVAPRLLDTGCGALGWWRLRTSGVAPTDEIAALRQSFRLHALQAAQHEQALQHLLTHFSEAGLVPVVFKGWTLTGFYAEPALRPYGDIDVLVDPSEEASARAILARLPRTLRGQVDLDMRVLGRFLPDRSYEDLCARASTRTLGEGRYRVLAPEDHLRLVCLHQLHHGGWRPLWLCDVAAFLEGLPSGFDWERCLQGNARLSDAVVGLVALAAELLGARLEPDAPRRPAPAWFREAMLRGWATGYQPPPASLYALRQLGWRRGIAAVRARWPDPISSTLHLRAPFRGVPRIVLQVAECARRAAVFLRRSWRDGFPASLSAVAENGQGVLP